MNQDEIFKLLLMLLLISNEKAGCNTGCNDGCNNSTFSSLNEIIICMFLMNACRPDSCNNSRNNDNDLNGNGNSFNNSIF